MPGLLADLVDELRTVGIPVSVGEHVDAAGAIAAIPLRDKEVLRAALQAALVKNAEHLSAFNLIFDLYTSGSPSSDPDEGPLAGLSDDELRDALRDAIARTTTCSGRCWPTSTCGGSPMSSRAGRSPG